MLLAVHYSQPPDWRWYILGYFFVAGLAGGAYTLGTLLRLWGRPADEQAARLCFLVTLPLVVICPLPLIADLGSPLRFWHMMIDTGVTGPGLIFKDWSPMSLGVWALLVFGALATITFLEVVALDGRYRYPASRFVGWLLGGALGRLVNVVGTLFALFVAGYTGVLLSVSNQPVWSDTYALGGLFLISGMGGAAAMIAVLTPWRPAAAASHEALADADAYFSLLELAFIAVLFVTLAIAGQFARSVGSPYWILLWLVAILSLVPPLLTRIRGGRVTVGGGGAAVMSRVGISATATALIVLVGVVALRAAVIWSAQG